MPTPSKPVHAQKLIIPTNTSGLVNERARIGYHSSLGDKTHGSSCDG